MRVMVLGIGGSLRQDSRSLQALEVALHGAAQAGADTELLDLRQLALPLYDDRSAVDSYPAGVFTLLDQVRRADGLILSTPVYHGILSGVIKNALDFLELLADEERPWLEGKVVGLISVAGGRPNDTAIDSLMQACRALHAWTVPLTVALAGSAFDAANRLQDERIEQRLLRMGQTVASAASLLAQPLQASVPALG